MPGKTPTLEQLEQKDDFIFRHIGPSDSEVIDMLAHLGMSSLDELIDKAIPRGIRSKDNLQLDRCETESDMLAYLRSLASRNKIFKSFIGMGYHGCITPPVILRNLLEDPSWYTAYTPYQAEISQGRLEGLLNFQTMLSDLTGLPVANASMLDEATAAAEAMSMSLSLRKRTDRHRDVFWVHEACHPQTLEVLQTRTQPLGVKLQQGSFEEMPEPDTCFGMLLSYPTTEGVVSDLSEKIESAHADGILVTVAADLLSLVVLKPPGEMGADVVVGSAQRFGVPFGFGGPHPGFFVTREAFKRSIPGRIVGASIDCHGRPALRLALQTREQHIRREKATSNICTSQVLLAVAAGMYAVYHGPNEMRRIARRTHRLAAIAAEGMRRLGHRVRNDVYFDTLKIGITGFSTDQLRRWALARAINLRYYEDGDVGIAMDETTRREHVTELWALFSSVDKVSFTVEELFEEVDERIPETLKRTSPILTHPVFNTHHSETEMLRYLKALAAKDLSLTHSMIPLGSCTMKLNASAEMQPITWPEFANIHPFAPKDQVKGYAQLISELEDMLSEITGFPGISLQPNAGSQGEYAGLLMIHRYHKSRNDSQRNLCLIPSSAHGTNPASATMAGMRVVVVNCDKNGNIDLNDLREKSEKNKDCLAALMITYPSTHGVFEEGITEICRIIHENGGQVYMDGANMNALVGLCKPGEFGPDVIHLNLHKTFCIPHGGGGPGVGPIGVAEHLVPHLPGHGLRADAFPKSASTAVSAAPWGSAGILPISWAYISMMGRGGMKKATQVAILNANYIAQQLEGHYPILYKGLNGLIAHECIIDVRPLKTTSGIEVEDIAKRLMDYGYHAPTMSWPVAGTLMIEPTESESKDELDRFIEVMISIRKEIAAIEGGQYPRNNNPLKNAPHTTQALVTLEWDRPYSRETAVFPLPWVATHKFWPSVGRVNNVYGDKNLVCSCLPVDSYRE